MIFISLRIIAEVMSSSNATNSLKSISLLFLFGSIALLAGLTFHHKKVYMHYKFRERAAIWVGIASTLISFLSIMYFGLYPAILAASLGPSTAGGLSLGFLLSTLVYFARRFWYWADQLKLFCIFLGTVTVGGPFGAIIGFTRFAARQVFPGAVGTLTMVCACGCQYLIMLTSRKLKEKTEHLHGLPKLLVTSLVVFIGVPSFGRVLAHLVDPTFSSFVGSSADRDVFTLLFLMVIFISMGIIVAYNDDMHKYFGGRIPTKVALCVYILIISCFPFVLPLRFCKSQSNKHCLLTYVTYLQPQCFCTCLWLSMLTALVISNKYEAENLRHLIEETFDTSSDESSDDGSDDSFNRPKMAGAIRIYIQSSKLLYTDIKIFWQTAQFGRNGNIRLLYMFYSFPRHLFWLLA